MKLITTTIMGLLTILSAFAQRAQITGKIHKNKMSPIPFVTISLKGDIEKPIAVGISNSEGIFKLENIPPGNYTIHYSIIGYTPTDRPIQIRKNTKLDLGIVTLEHDTKLLQEVSITSVRSSINLKLDKKVFEVGKDVLSQSGALTDLLNIVPSVSVSPNGTISLRGNNNVLVLIDGRRTGLTQSNALDQLPAEQVERIEVITNPSSRFDAAGSAGIINIILRKNKKAGFNGQLRLVAGIPNDTRISPSLNFKSDKINLFATYGIRLSDYVGLYTMAQTTGTLGNICNVKQSQNENRHDDGRLLYFGADYQLNKYNVLTAAYMRNSTNDHDKTHLNYLYFGKNAAIDSSVTRDGESWEKRSYNQVEFNYTKTFDQAVKKFSIDMQYDFWDSDKNWSLSTIRMSPTITALPSIRTKSTGNSQDLMIKTDMIQPIDSNAILEFGLKMEDRRVNSNFIAEQDRITGWEIIEQIDNHLLYKELIGSGYAQFSSKIGNISFQAGLRNEFTRIGIDDRVGTYTNKKNYNRFFPTLNINYTVNTTTNMQFSYSKRINRPKLGMLYPFNELTDLSSRYIGNPALNPAYSNVLEMTLLKNWKKLTVNPSLYYQGSKGIIEDYTFKDSNGLFITMPVNIYKETRQGFELSLIYNPVKWLQINTELNVFHYQEQGNYEQQNFNYSGNTFTTRINSQLKLKNKFSFQTIYSFRGANATAQTRTNAVHGLDVGSSKNFLKDKATLTFDVNNLFALRKFKSRTVGPDYEFNQSNLPNAARYRLTLVYRFNQKDNQWIRQAKSGNRD